MPAQAPPRDRWRVVRAGLGLGLAIFALATVAAQVDAQSAQSAPSAPSGLPLVLAPETAPALLFALLLGLGIAGQVAGRYYASRRRPASKRRRRTATRRRLAPARVRRVTTRRGRSLVLPTVR